MEFINKKNKKDPHPYIPELKELYRNGRITRREFLRNATLLGMSAAAAYAFAPAFGLKSAQAATIKRGGTWKCAMPLGKIDHPARLSWLEGSNVLRQAMEYLTETGPDNITRPWLLEKWAASEDVKTWDLYLSGEMTGPILLLTRLGIKRKSGRFSATTIPRFMRSEPQAFMPTMKAWTPSSRKRKGWRS